MVPGDTAIARSYQGLAADVAWLLFFAPVGAAGVALLWSTLRKMGALEEAAEWFAQHTEHERVSSAYGKREGASAVRTEADPHGLESLGEAEVARLERQARRIALLLGSAVGGLLAGGGIFGLGYQLFFSRPYPDSAVSGTLTAAGLTIRFAILCGMCVLAGLVVLRQTFTRERGGWLVPLQVFTNLILVRWRKEQRARGDKRIR
ncbi:MAG TPA: hypothetical protein VE263_12870 [Candidatus Angelobacter sp.]|nr:hypothetical protein [Candidatus Angelobacter sp.]